MERYNITVNGDAASIRTNGQREFAMASGEMPPTQSRAFLEPVLMRIAAAPHARAIGCVCIDWRHVADLIEAYQTAGAELKNVCVWATTSFDMSSMQERSFSHRQARLLCHCDTCNPSLRSTRFRFALRRQLAAMRSAGDIRKRERQYR